MEGIIVKGVGGLYTVDTPMGLVMCKPRGIFRKKEIALSPLVGDGVFVSLLEDGSGVIEKINDRKTLLTRPKVANITQAIIVFAYKEPDLHLDLLDRFIVNCEAVGINISIIFNKIDLLKENDKKKTQNIRKTYEKAGYKVIEVSVYENIGIDQIENALIGEMTVFAGPSGAGKSSIFNMISDEELMETGELSEKIRRGKHTTRHSQLIKLDKDSYVADSPGFSAVHFEDIGTAELKHFFREFSQLQDGCRFADCNHIDEPDCKVKEEVFKGSIAEIRYKRYLSFYEELRGAQ
ncbi:MAG: ribosome small subunit-dependent GTPase A [Defluviitaleaceae bacterium]|nr:ribosome small subunit-dependent GTPase A [Defluviitaleaceae bacterium]